MKILTSPSECSSLLHANGILTSSDFKKLLNDYYKPDEHLFFQDGPDVIPIVIKNGMATFYGGKISNEYNYIPSNRELLNKAMSFMISKNIKFRLLSIISDPIDNLNEEYKKLDVPTKCTWKYQNIGSYDFNSMLVSMKQKKRTRYRKLLSLIGEQYNFKTISPQQFYNDKERVLKRQIESFDLLGKKSGWEGNEELFFKIMHHFINNYNVFIRYLYKENEEVGNYVIVYSRDEIVIYFAGYYSRDDYKVSSIIYLDKLERAKEIGKANQISEADSLRGSFTYKKRMGFTPIPLYALVNDDSWEIKFDDDLTREEYYHVYKRKFGCQTEASVV